jgi:hypothetical protein
MLSVWSAAEFYSIARHDLKPESGASHEAGEQQQRNHPERELAFARRN